MRDERETRAFRRLVLQRARSELRLARLRKRQRAADTARTFRLGAIGARFGWQNLPPPELDHCVEAVRRLVADVPSHDALRSRADRRYADDEPAPAAFVAGAEARADQRRRVVLGARLLDIDPDGTLDPRVLSGALAVVDEQRSVKNG